MAELLDEVSQIESTTVAVQRTASTVKGGRRFSFGALVVVGDRRGKVGYGYGKSNEVPSAIEKAQKYARKAMVSVPLSGTTIPHQVEGTFSASKVRLVPAAPGTGTGSTRQQINSPLGKRRSLGKNCSSSGRKEVGHDE